MSFNASFTGSRDYDSLNPRNATEITRIAELVMGCHLIDNIHFGGAMGIDTDLLIACARNKPMKTSYHKTLVACIPNVLDNLNPFARNAVEKYADEIIELKNPIHKADWFRSYHIRDKFMVDNCTKLFAFINKSALEAKKGGTWATIKFSLRNKHEIVSDMSWNENNKETIIFDLEEKHE
jgi:hypothetical protein